LLGEAKREAPAQTELRPYLHRDFPHQPVNLALGSDYLLGGALAFETGRVIGLEVVH
jgi:hypothetical protein